MSYMGNVELKASNIRRFDVTGSTSATHTLTWTAPNEQSLIVTINGVKQQNNYTVSGTTLTLDTALITTDALEVIGINDVGTTITPAQGSVNADQLATDAVSTVKIADDAVTDAKLANSINTDIAANTAKVTNATHTGDVTGATVLTIADDAVDIAMLIATGTDSATTFLRGDNAWAAAGGGAWELVASVTAAANTSTTIGGDASPIFSSAHDNYVLIGVMQTKSDVLTAVAIQPILAGAGTTADTVSDIQHAAPMMRSNNATGTTALTWSDQDLNSNYAVSLNYNPLGTGTGEAHSFQMWFYDPFQNASFSHYQLANATVASFDANAYTSVLTYAYRKATSTGYVGLVISNGAAGGVDYLLRLYGIKNS